MADPGLGASKVSPIYKVDSMYWNSSCSRVPLSHSDQIGARAGLVNRVRARARARARAGLVRARLGLGLDWAGE